MQRRQICRRAAGRAAFCPRKVPKGTGARRRTYIDRVSSNPCQQESQFVSENEVKTMSVKEYSLKRDGDQKVSADFRVREFRCKDGSDKILLSPETVKIIQSVRDYFGKPVTINSAYRTPQYNKKVGGASNSQHVKGTACDIAVKDVPPKAVAAYLEAFFPKTGIGLYGSFVHVDTRGYAVRWKNTGSNTVKAFGLGKIYEKYRAQKNENNGNDGKEEEEMTQAQFDKMLDNYFARLAEKKPNDWSEEDRKWAEENKIIQGDPDGSKRYGSFITREEAAAMIHRAVEKLEEKK